VFVALADNFNQGIVPVSAKLGNGDNPKTNLYWGAGSVGAVDGDRWLDEKESDEKIRLRAADAYHKYQKCGVKAARGLFATGW